MKIASIPLLTTFLSREYSIAPIRFNISASESGQVLERVLKDRGYAPEGHYTAMHPELGLYVDVIDGFKAPRGYFFSFSSHGSSIQQSVDRYVVSTGESIGVTLERICTN